MTQQEIAGERFSKAYVSQLERGHTRATQATLEWLANRLGVDVSYLVSGVSSDDRIVIENLLLRGEALNQERRYEDAIAAFANVRARMTDHSVPELRVRSLTGEAWARLERGELKSARRLLDRAQTLVDSSRCSGLDRAEVLFLLGVYRYQSGSAEPALDLLNQALALAEESGLPCDRLRARIFEWRSRCHRRRRDLEAAHADVERAVELCESGGDRGTLGRSYFQASLIAERQGRLVLARSYAERAKAMFEEVADRIALARSLNNIGFLLFQLGKPEDATVRLKEAFAVAIDVGDEVAASSSVSSLARVHLGCERFAEAERLARHALELLGERDDRLDEIGTTLVILGRSLLEQGRAGEAAETLDRAERAFATLGSTSHLTLAWSAQGDLAARRGDFERGFALYRKATQALQDTRL
jgi:tetratricopeptide (TPR) repeat protein